ncbi:hypothetical protein B0H14DRAFT_1693790 [Mycena olivaceomarginata]|nr:hypothetical protein B0H14DRAFT_1693790 [Mycena olivaceomarginata]
MQHRRRTDISSAQFRCLTPKATPPPFSISPLTSIPTSSPSSPPKCFRCSHSLTNGTATVQVPGGELVSLDQDPSPISRNAEWIHFTGTGSEPLLQNWTDSLRDPQGFIGLVCPFRPRRCKDITNQTALAVGDTGTRTRLRRNGSAMTATSQWADLWAKITFLFLSDGRMDSALMYHLGPRQLKAIRSR